MAEVAQGFGEVFGKAAGNKSGGQGEAAAEQQQDIPRNLGKSPAVEQRAARFGARWDEKKQEGDEQCGRTVVQSGQRRMQPAPTGDGEEADVEIAAENPNQSHGNKERADDFLLEAHRAQAVEFSPDNGPVEPERGIATAEDAREEEPGGGQQHGGQRSGVEHPLAEGDRGGGGERVAVDFQEREVRRRADKRGDAADRATVGDGEHEPEGKRADPLGAKGRLELQDDRQANGEHHQRGGGVGNPHRQQGGREEETAQNRGGAGAHAVE